MTVESSAAISSRARRSRSSRVSTKTASRSSSVSLASGRFRAVPGGEAFAPTRDVVERPVGLPARRGPAVDGQPAPALEAGERVGGAGRGGDARRVLRLARLAERTADAGEILDGVAAFGVRLGVGLGRGVGSGRGGRLEAVHEDIGAAAAARRGAFRAALRAGFLGDGADGAAQFVGRAALAGDDRIRVVEQRARGAGERLQQSRIQGHGASTVRTLRRGDAGGSAFPVGSPGK
ncbi:MAG: hypothetical protein NXI21_00900 [Alphaproteobacteria bacterium]|nr:hypothetical protein [Alphaproteobacteria bacterium]